MKLEHSMRVEILNLNCSIKDGLKIVSKIKKVVGLRYVRVYIVQKFHSEFRIHKNCV